MLSLPPLLLLRLPLLPRAPKPPRCLRHRFWKPVAARLCSPPSLCLCFLQVLDATSTVTPDYHDLKEVRPGGSSRPPASSAHLGGACRRASTGPLAALPARPSHPFPLPSTPCALQVALFLTQANVLPPGMGLALYVSIGGADWAYRGFVSNQHPSEVMPLSWPEAPGGQGLGAPPGPGYAQLGISLEPLGELGQKEGSKLGAREDFAKCVGLDLFNFMQVGGCVPGLPCGGWCTRV